MRFITGLLLVLMVVSAVSAELLVTANPFGKGKWVFEGAYLSDANVANSSGMSAATVGAYCGYGINDKLDFIVAGGQANVAGLPVGVSALKTTGYGVNLKYALASEEKDLPVSVAVGGGYKLLSQVTTVTGLGDTTENGNQLLLAIGISKIMVPFIPYAGIDYRAISYNASNLENHLDLTIGTAIAWSMQGAVLVEYSRQSITPTNGSGNYTSGQIAAGVAYKI